MAASTQNREAGRKTGDIVSVPLQAAVKVNKGTLVNVDNTGYSRPARSGTATDVFAGVAYDGADNTLGAAGAINTRVYKSGTFLFPKSVATAQTDLGQKVYAADDQTVTLTATNNQFVGIVVQVVDAANVRVRIDQAAQ